MFDGICYSPTSDSFLVAKPLQGPPTNATVYLSLFTKYIRKISAIDASFEYDAYLDVAWRDDRFNVSALEAVALASTCCVVRRCRVAGNAQVSFNLSSTSQFSVLTM